MLTIFCIRDLLKVGQLPLLKIRHSLLFVIFICMHVFHFGAVGVKLYFICLWGITCGSDSCAGQPHYSAVNLSSVNKCRRQAISQLVNHVAAAKMVCSIGEVQNVSANKSFAYPLRSHSGVSLSVLWHCSATTWMTVRAASGSTGHNCLANQI